MYLIFETETKTGEKCYYSDVFTDIESANNWFSKVGENIERLFNRKLTLISIPTKRYVYREQLHYLTIHGELNDNTKD
jgi:hypothetical protein